MRKPGAPDQLQQVQELNRAFLGLLQTRARAHRPCLGLPSEAHAALAATGSSLLEAAATFPRALFQVELPGEHRREVSKRVERGQLTREEAQELEQPYQPRPVLGHA